MNWRLFLGSSINSAKHSVLSSSCFPLTRYIPRGNSWLYDAQRFANTRQFSVVFDVGANTGQTAKSLTMYCKSSHIYCFEPVKATFAVLEKSYDKYENVHCINKALGSSRGVAEIRLHKNSELNTLVSNQPRIEDLTDDTEELRIETIDLFCAENSVESIDILKMDVQGWEIEVLKGSEKMLSENRIRFIYSEVGFRKSDADMQNFGQFNDFMEDRGYWFCGFYDHFRWGDKKQFLGFSNALYLNPKNA
jgi:FkbM family methyltransferase